MAIAALAACATPPELRDTAGQTLSGTPAGSVPGGLPARLLVGLREDTGATWMSTSGVAWDLRYRYLTKGWANNWGFGPYDGAFALDYMQESSAQARVPAIAYYAMNESPGGGEDAFYAKTQNATTMASYFADFKLLMQRAKDFDRPVVILVEADGFAYLQKQSAGNRNAYAAVAASGLPELAGLPNTIAGWGLAFLQLRKSVGASKAILGIHVSGWATGHDLFFDSVSESLQPAVDAAYNFLAPLGLASNVTGNTWDVLVTDPLDRDADYYLVVQQQDRRWDPADGASVTARSFNRHAEWLRLWNVKAGKRWVLWQLPIGNSASTNVCNAGGPRQGYKDNRSEYFFGSRGAAHRDKFASSGVIALLFGAGEGCQASYQNDQDSAGALYLKTNAGAYLAAGGLAVPAVPAGAGSDTSMFGFETGTQGFSSVGPVPATLSSSTAQAFAGTHSLAVAYAGGSTGNIRVSVAPGTLAAGSTIAFHLWVPSSAQIDSVQPFVQEGSSVNFRWTANWVAASGLTRNAWSTINITMPADLTPAQSLGVEIGISGTAATTIYIDAIGGSGSGGGTSPDPDPAPSGCMKIMPLGDSITLGVNGGYRNGLYNAIRADGCGVNFVGSLSDEFTEVPDHDHEGHSGISITDIAANANAWLSAAQPDYVLLMAGTNDIAWWSAETGAQVADRHAQLIDQILAARPNAWVIVATIPPITSQTIDPNGVDRAQLGRDLNAGIRSRVATRQAAGKKVRLADVYNVLTVADLYDGVHPTQEAHARVAAAFHAALQPVATCSAAPTCGP